MAFDGSIESAWASVIESLGYNVDDPHLSGSPARVARFLREWHTKNSAPPVLTTFPNDGYDELIIVGGIPFYSMCAHHGLPFHGSAAVGYIPRPREAGGRIVGLSKIARVVDHYARRFQTQEQLTRDVANLLMDSLNPLGVGAVLRAEHLCMSMRGIQRPGHSTVTSDMRGVFREKSEARAELMALVR